MTQDLSRVKQSSLTQAYQPPYQPECYQELLAYKLAFNEAMRLYWLLPLLPAEEEELLSVKLVETSRVVCALLAQAWGARQYRSSFVAGLTQAEAKVAAMQTWIAFAVECGYVEAEVGQTHCELCADILNEIRRLVQAATVVVELAG